MRKLKQMKAPKFWAYGSNDLCIRCLSPFAALYGALTTKRAQNPAKWHAPIPLICIGNLIMGGAGKTPTAIAVAQELITQGMKPFFLSRGYGGTLKGPLLVDGHTAAEVGDEPLLLLKTAPVCIAHDRILGAKLCVEAGADIIIMDDGFQNPSLHKDLSILVIDGGYGHGNEKVFPAGPLRESLLNGLKRAHACVMIGRDETQTIPRLSALRPNLKLLQAHIKVQNQNDLPKTKIIAFAGIGRPEKFFNTLKNIGANVVSSLSFSDHHYFSETDIKHLQTLAKQNKAELITTEKDWLRLPPSFQTDVKELKITLEWEDKDMLKTVLSPLNL
jgi:tetraacyldisaccharide 4'-kinase